MDYKIISDGCCDLEKEIIEQYNLRIIPFYISFDEETYYKAFLEKGGGTKCQRDYLHLHFLTNFQNSVMIYP